MADQLHFQLALIYYKEEKNRAGLDYQENMQLVALWKQVIRGKLDETKEKPVGFFDFVGKDRRRAWRALGDMTQAEAMTLFCEKLKTQSAAYPEWLSQRLKEKEEKERRDREQQERERQVREQFERERQERIRRQEEERARLERERLEREREDQRLKSLAAKKASSGDQRRPAPPIPGAPASNPLASSTAILKPLSDNDKLSVEAFKKLVVTTPSAMLIVSRGEVVRVKIPNPGGEPRRIVWQFMTEAYDIGFGLEYEASALPDPSSPRKAVPAAGETSTSPGELETRAILPVVRCDVAQQVLMGSHTCDATGSWLLLFDNSYSYFRSKTIYYHVEYKPIV